MNKGIRSFISFNYDSNGLRSESRGLFIQENPPAMADAALSGLHAHLVLTKGPLRQSYLPP
jgi:hypothetical protein